MTSKTQTNPSSWTPVTIDWNGKPFVVELVPELYPLRDEDNLPDEELYWIDEQEKKHQKPLMELLLIGQSKSIAVQLHTELSDPFVPDRLKTSTKSDCHMRSDGWVIVDDKTIECRYRICKTDSKLSDKMRNRREVDSTPKYSKVLARGRRFEVLGGFSVVRDRVTKEAYPIHQFSMLCVFEAMVRNNLSVTHARSTADILDSAKHLYEERNPKAGKVFPSHQQLSHFFRYSEKGRKITHSVYSLLVKFKSARPPAYYIDLSGE